MKAMDISTNYLIQTECVAKRGDYFYLIGREMNVMFIADTKLKSYRIVFNMPDENKAKERLFVGNYIENDTMILVPYNAEKVWLYDFILFEWTGIDISKYVDTEAEAKFVGGAINNGKAFLFGYEYKGILVIDLVTREVMELFDDNDRGDYSFWGLSTVTMDDKIYVASRTSNELICIDTKKVSYSKIQIEKSVTDNITNDGVACCNNNIYIMPNHGKHFYKYSFRNEIEIMNMDDFYDTNKSYFNGIAVSPKCAIFFSHEKKSYVHSFRDISESRILDEEIRYAIYDENIGFIVCKPGKLCIYDENMYLVKEMELLVSKSIHQKYINAVSPKDISMKQENIFYDLNDYLQIISNMK